MSNCNRAIDQAQGYINNALPGALSTLYATIRTRAPRAKVVVVGYPRIFNGTDCNAFTWFSGTEMSRLNATADLLNSRLAAAASATGFTFANPTVTLHRPRGLRQPGVDQRPVRTRSSSPTTRRRPGTPTATPRPSARC